MPDLRSRFQFEKRLATVLASAWVAFSNPFDIPWPKYQAATQKAVRPVLEAVFLAASNRMVSDFSIGKITPLHASSAASIWAEDYSRDLAVAITDSSQRKVARAKDQDEETAAILLVLLMGTERLESIAISEVTQAVTSGEDYVVRSDVLINQQPIDEPLRMPTDADIRPIEVVKKPQTPTDPDAELEKKPPITKEPKTKDGKPAVGPLEGQNDRLPPLPDLPPDSPAGTILHAWWVTEYDGRVCPICAPLHGSPEEVWRKTIPQGPRAHPRCRCILIYSRVAIGSFPGSIEVGPKGELFRREPDVRIKESIREECACCG